MQMQQEEGQDISISGGLPLVISFEWFSARPTKDGEGDIVF